jgi:antitoxin ParD1/3/4
MAVESWLQREGAPTYDSLKADRSRGRSVQDVRAALAAEHRRATKAR